VRTVPPVSVPVITVPLPWPQHPVDTRAGRVDGCRCGGDQSRKRCAHRVDALAGGGAHGHDGGLRQERAREVVAHVHLLQLTPLVVDQVGLGERDEAVLQTHQLEDAEVLFALRFPALGGRHHEHARIDATDPRQHVAEEANVPWHVDEADAFAIAEEGVREAEVDGETAATFLFEAIWVGAGERLHQRRLAMVHVPAVATTRMASERSEGCSQVAVVGGMH
jgi:hypothetical protein